MVRTARLGLLVLLAAGSGAAGEKAGSEDTPVARVMGLLKDMSKALQKEMDEDEALYKEMGCWCGSGNNEKTEAIEKSTAKIEELKATIESLSASSNELTTTVRELKNGAQADEGGLKMATEIRQKQAKQFHKMEIGDVQAIENLKAALTVLDKHHGDHSTVPGGASFLSESDSLSFLEVRSKELPWSEAHEASLDEHSLKEFMRTNGFSDDPDVFVDEKPVAPHKFLQQAQAQAVGNAGTSAAWSAEDTVVVKRALKSVAAFVQAKRGSDSGNLPAYQSQSGEIVGILKQMHEEMTDDLSRAQKRESERSADFEELRSAKNAEITDGTKMAEQKEAELAKTDVQLAEAKKDLGQEKKVLAEDQAFLNNLKVMCADSDRAFDERKKARMGEMQAVSDTIEILQGDEARDAMSNTFNSFVQVSSTRTNSRRTAAAQTLRSAARRTHSVQLSILASAVQLDAFAKVKQAIDEMITAMKQQQEDEVKKNDWCEAEIHSNEVATTKTDDRREDLEAKIGELESSSKALEEGITDAKAQIKQAEVNLQRASQDRRKENIEFQKTVADQTTTMAILRKAVDRLSAFYDLLQTKQRATAGQTPPQQKEYKPNSGAGGVMEMIEKLIRDSADLRKKSQQEEGEAEADYEKLVASTNDSIQALQKEVVFKTEAYADAKRERLTAKQDLADSIKELSELGQYNGELHQECDYIMKNFDLRQKTRTEEMEALRQAKQILDGASFN